MEETIYKITKIAYRDGTDRIEPDYIKRIGKIGTIAYLKEGGHLIFVYTEQTAENKGALKTSPIQHIGKTFDGKSKVITTENSIFWLEEVDKTEQTR
jgi:hypothetical protein